MKGKQLTNEDVVKAMYDLVGDEYTKLDDKYVKNDVKFKIRHEKCGYEFETTWKSFKKKQTCANCSGRRKYTDSEINNLIHDMTNGEYTKISTYKNASTKFRIKHNLCGHEYEVNWNNFRAGKRCPKCAGNINYTNEEIVKKIYDLVGNEYSKVDDFYVDRKTKFKIRHNTCGHEYMTSWHSFKQGKARCINCKEKSRKFTGYTNKDILKKISDLVGNEYTKLDDNYVNSETKFKIRHNKCGHEYGVCWDKFKQGSRCPKCASNNGKYTDSEINNFIHEMTNGEYTKLSVYKNVRTKFKIRHNKCGCEYEVRWDSFKQGKRCPKCSSSKGERFIADYLTNHNISFSAQVKFSGCRYKKPLPFDFAILDSEKKILALIEYNGQQHYEPVEAWGGEEKLKLTQLRDAIKNEYCAKNKIPLLRIKYDEDIEEKLSLFLAKRE